MNTGRKFTVISVLAVVSFASACQIGSSGPDPSDRGGAAVLGLRQPKPAQDLEKISASELRAYCPKIVLRHGTAFHTNFERGGEGDRSKVRYQASISDVTRSCKYGGSMLTMHVAAAGKLVPGPVASGDSVSLPIRVAILRGTDVLYSQLYPHPVSVSAGAGATQFVFSDPNIQVPAPTSPNYRVFVGFDDGKSGDN